MFSLPFFTPPLLYPRQLANEHMLTAVVQAMAPEAEVKAADAPVTAIEALVDGLRCALARSLDQALHTKSLFRMTRISGRVSCENIIFSSILPLILPHPSHWLSHPSSSPPHHHQRRRPAQGQLPGRRAAALCAVRAEVPRGVDRAASQTGRGGTQYAPAFHRYGWSEVEGV
jgi:hypothetical protein